MKPSVNIDVSSESVSRLFCLPLLHPVTSAVLASGKKRECGRTSLNVAIRPQRPYGLIGTGSPERPPGLSHSS